MRRIPRVYCLTVAVLLLGFSGSQLKASPLWRNLEAGRYRVGYKTILTYDLSRPSISRDATGREIRSAHQGRQMQIGVWYPTTSKSSRSFMQFEEYVYLLAQELDFSPLTENRRQEAITSFMRDPLSRGVSEAQLQSLMKIKTGAVKNAPPTGRFPLVVYAHVAPSGNNIMCEYLASHGYVVATIPWKGTFEYNLDVGLTGVETQIKDIEFAIGLLRKEPNVDGNKIATIGMSFGAISALGLQSRNADVDAVISLDGGIGSAFGAAVVQRTPYYSQSRISAPLLHLYGSSVPGTDLTFLNSLKYSRRYFIGFRGMRHADFTNQGLLEQFIPSTKNTPPGDSKQGFEWMCRYALRFLNAYLKDDVSSLVFLVNVPDANGVPNGVLTAETKRGLQLPPTPQALQSMIDQSGIGIVAIIYSELKKADPQPLSQQTLSDVARWLVEKNDLQSAKEIVDLRLDSYPTSAWANYAAAEIYRRLGKSERAQQLYQEALRLLPGDFDPEIDSRRRGIYEGSRRNLEALRSP